MLVQLESFLSLGTGSFLIEQARRKKADIFISSDIKYHEFFDANEELIIVDIGHYESEQFTINLIYENLKEKFSNFALHLTAVKWRAKLLNFSLRFS